MSGVTWKRAWLSTVPELFLALVVGLTLQTFVQA